MATRADYARSLLQGLGIVPGEANFDTLVAVQSFEDSNALNNPLDTTLPEPGATNYNSVGVRNYPTFSEGVEATLSTLNEGRYAHFRDVLRGSDTTAMAMALAAGGWAGTEPATVVAYTKDLEAMIHTVSLDRERYYTVEVAGSKAVADTPVPEEQPHPETWTEAQPQPHVETPAPKPEPEIEKVESAIGAEAGAAEAASDAGKAGAVRVLTEKIRVHLAELEELIR